MPHLIIECSKNLQAYVDLDQLVGRMHQTAASIDALPTGGIRTRLVVREHCSVADGHTENGFIYVTLRIGQGRPRSLQKQIGEQLFATLNGYVDRVFDTRPLSLGLEIQEIDPETRWKRSNIRDYMKRRESQSTDSP